VQPPPNPSASGPPSYYVRPVSRNRNETQFDEYREWQWCKHTALGDYIVPWSMKVGSTADTIFIADLFAGKGTYDDVVTGRKTDGSPVIFARRAMRYMEERPGKTMHVICTERNRTNFASLERRMARFVPGYATLLWGNFALHRDTVLEQMSGSPALILLDPIGLKSLPAEVCRPLFQRLEKTDVFIILHFKVLHRTAGMLLPTGHADPMIQGAGKAAETFDAVFGSPRWRFIACQPDLTTLEREQRYLRLYYEDVLGPRYSWKCAFPVRPKYESAVKYWLVQASDYIDAFTIMNDEIVKLDALLFLHTIDDPGALEGFIEAEIKARYDATLVELGQAMLGYLSKQPGRAAPFGQIREALLGGVLRPRQVDGLRHRDPELV
jgi:three-Cys-motif partner protein